MDFTNLNRFSVEELTFHLIKLNPVPHCFLKYGVQLTVGICPASRHIINSATIIFFSRTADGKREIIFTLRFTLAGGPALVGLGLTLLGLALLLLPRAKEPPPLPRGPPRPPPREPRLADPLPA